MRPYTAVSVLKLRDMGWAETFTELGRVIARREELLAAGATGGALTSAVKEGYLIRVRRDHYALPSTPAPILRSVRVGGRIGCISALVHNEVFALDSSATHAHLPRETSRPRHPDHRSRPLAASRAGAVVHWGELMYPHDCSEFSVGISDALAQAIQCQPDRSAVASVDNALFLRAIQESELREIFAHLPERYRALEPRVDGRAEAGQETVLRMALEDAGLHCELQVELDGVGRVDLVVEGCVVVEADSRLAHDGWEMHVRDRDRDINAARLGFPTLRPAYRRTMFATNDVVEAVRELLRSQRNYRALV